MAWLVFQADKLIDGQSARVNAKPYYSCERLGVLFVWLHADGLAPAFELDILSDMEDSDRMRYVETREWPDFHMHVKEPSENSADWYGGCAQ